MELVRIAYIIEMMLIIAISNNKFKRLLNISTIISFIWIFFGFISTFGLYGLRIPSIKVHVYSMIFVFSLVLTIVVTKKSIIKSSNVMISFDTYIKRAKMVQLTMCIFISPLVFFSIQSAIQFGSITGARKSYYSIGYFDSIYMDFVFKSMPMACCSALIIVFCYASFQSGKIKYALLALFDAILLAFISGGRYSLISFIYCLFILKFLSPNKEKNSVSIIIGDKVKKYIAIGIVMLAIVTVVRGQNIFEQLIKYFAGGFSYLDLILENPSDFGLNGYTYGYLTFGAITEPIVLVLKVLGISTPNVPEYQINIYCQTFHNIGDEAIIMYNANTTILYYFISDLGFCGIIIGGILLGKVIAITYNMWNRCSWYGALLFMYFSIVALNSIMIYQFFGKSAIVVIFVLWFVTQNKFEFGWKQLIS